MASGPAPLVFCGPSGAGKSTLVKMMMEEFKNKFGFSVSHTTRSPRQGEENGKQYNFVTREEMQTAIDNGEFIEHAVFANNMYGTSKAAVKKVQDEGKICVLDIDVQGVKSIKKTDLSPNYIFIKPPSLEELEKRLKGRGTESEESLSRRLVLAKRELAYGEEEGNFDIVIVNDDLKKAYEVMKQFLLQRYEELKKV